MGESVTRSHLHKMLRVCLVLSLLLCLGLPAPNGLVRTRRQLAPPGPSLGFLSNQTTAAAGQTVLAASDKFSLPTRSRPARPANPSCRGRRCPTRRRFTG